MEDRCLSKAKRVDNGEWIVGYLYRLSENNPPFIMLSDRYGESYEVYKHTICQCTGLKDKNGKMIWEKDIVNAITSNQLGEPVYIKNIVVVTSDYKLMFKLDFSNELERVGNIFDNPELVNKREETYCKDGNDYER